MTPLFSALALGLVIGAQHAFEPDHVAAVSTMLPGETSLRSASLRGAWWGLGHGAAIAAIGVPLVILGIRVPESFESAAEFVVALMLIGLGARAIWSAWHRDALVESVARNPAVRSGSVGLIHGLAGSGAAVVLATADAPSRSVAIGFLLLFVVGSTLSMAAAAALVSVPVRRVASKAERISWVLAASGVVSVIVGLIWAGPHVSMWIN